MLLFLSLATAMLSAEAGVARNGLCEPGRGVNFLASRACQRRGRGIEALALTAVRGCNLDVMFAG